MAGASAGDAVRQLVEAGRLAAEGRLAAWLDTIYFKVLRLTDVELPDQRLDYSVESLRGLPPPPFQA